MEDLKQYFPYVLDNGKDVDMTHFCDSPNLDWCEAHCPRYYDCYKVALANDILVAYEDYNYQER